MYNKVLEILQNGKNYYSVKAKVNEYLINI